jgi:hypothetical protein
VRTVVRRLVRLEEHFAPADRKPRRYYRLVVCKWGSRTGLENATCRRTLCRDGTVAELVELYGSNEGPESIPDKELDKWVTSFPIEVPAMQRAR